ncbi:MAG TPA: hypothetical protein DIW31_02740 [Bacteroidales bacterium]|nr:hypothetical protein [Bacteroidales bacterium]
MNTNLIDKENIKNTILSIVISILTFPKFEPDFTIGLDSPYMWALNYLFLNNYEFLKHLIFPIGILGFLKHPVVVGNCVLYAVIFFSTVKFLFVFLLLKLAQTPSLRKWIFNIVLVLFVSAFINIDFAIIGSCIFLLYFFSIQRNHLLFILPVLLATIGLFIKSSIGVNSFGVILVFFIHNLFDQKNIKQTLIYAGITVVVVFLTGITIFQNATLLVNAIWSILMLVKGYSSALALFPENNWMFLSIFIVSILSVPFLFKEKNSRYFYFLFLLPLFFMWKHSILREESSHYSMILGFSIIFWIIVVISLKQIKPIHVIIPILSIGFLWGNLKYIDSNARFKVNLSGLKNFSEVFLNYKSFIERNQKISKENIKPSRLSKDMLQKIGKSTIDFYPWDFSYVPANNLNWKPRTTLQSGAFSEWLDLESAQNFTKEEGPKFILLHVVNDWNYGLLGSNDGRHLLNEEPKTIIEIFNRYSIVRKEDDLLLFKKDSIDKFLPALIVGTDTTIWNKWVDVPSFDDAIVRAKLICKGNIVNKLKTFLYKGEALYVDFKLDNGREISYGLVESSAKDGVWVNPFIQNPFNNTVEPKVVGIRFRCSNTFMYSPQLIINWEKIGIKDSNGNSAALTLFSKNQRDQKEVLKEKYFDFERNDGSENNHYTNRISHSGNISNIVYADGFSQGYEFSLDTIWNNTVSSINVEAEVYYNSYEVKNCVLVFSLEKSEGSDFWESRKLNISNNDWNYAFIEKRINKDEFNKGLFKVYVCNPNKTKGNIYIDDLRVRFIKQE